MFTSNIFLAVILSSLLQTCNSLKKEQMMDRIDFYTSHHQFYISDKGILNNLSEDFWNEGANDARMAVQSGVLGVLIGNYDHVRTKIQVCDGPSNSPSSTYDHMVEAGVDCKSGLLQILDCPNMSVEFEIKIKPGKYRVRVYSYNLMSVDLDEDAADDHYKIEIYPSNSMERKVLKNYEHK